MTLEEKAAIGKPARSRTAAAREVERARIILLASKGKRVPAIAQELELTEITVRTWLNRFNNPDIGENGRLKLAIFTAFFTFSVKLFEFDGLAQDRITLSA
jgi:hypothetical protein